MGGSLVVCHIGARWYLLLLFYCVMHVVALRYVSVE